MAEPLKLFFDETLVRRIADSIRLTWPAFPHAAFVRDAAKGLDDLELIDRGRHIAGALRNALPSEYPEAIGILVRSLGGRRESLDGNGMAPFFYLPHTLFVSEYGLDHFDASMRAQHAITQRFTCEFSIRPFLVLDEARTLAVLETWARDRETHVRRLVSEGTRPRLPWAMRLRRFQEDPTPVLRLLEVLKDDPELFVRRSVANNLNDIAKDHPDRVIEVCRRWLHSATEERRWVVRHALRSLVKKVHADALVLLGFDVGEHVRVEGRVRPSRVRVGDTVEIALVLRNDGDADCTAQADVVVHFVKANGQARPKVFKGAGLKLAPGEQREVSVRVSLRDMTTRRHYPGEHHVDARVNGRDVRLGAFKLQPDAR